MRALAFANTADVVDRVRPMRGLGPLGEAAARYLTDAASTRVVQQRSVDLLLPVLYDAARAAAARPLAAVFAASPGEETWARAYAGARPTRAERALTWAALRRVAAFEHYALARVRPPGPRVPARGGVSAPDGPLGIALAPDVGGEPGPAPCTPRVRRGTFAGLAAPGTPGDGSADPGARALSLSGLVAVEAEAWRLLRAAEQRDARGSADSGELLRAALVACCLAAGATPADLAALVLDDLAPGRVWAVPGRATFLARGRSHWADLLEAGVAPTWRVMRVARRAQGAAKARPTDLPLPPVARRAIARWLVARAAARPWTLVGDARVFVDPDLPGLPPLDRRQAGKWVSGLGRFDTDERALGVVSTAATNAAGLPGARTARSARAATAVRGALVAGDPLVSRGAVATGEPTPDDLRAERVLVSPSALRHVLGVRLTAHSPPLARATAALAERLGLQDSQRSAARYRALLGLTGADRPSLAEQRGRAAAALVTAGAAGETPAGYAVPRPGASRRAADGANGRRA